MVNLHTKFDRSTDIQRQEMTYTQSQSQTARKQYTTRYCSRSNQCTDKTAPRLDYGSQFAPQHIKGKSQYLHTLVAYMRITDVHLPFPPYYCLRKTSLDTCSCTSPLG